MKIIYECDVCGNRYKNKGSAIACEKQGVFNVSEFQIGTMFEYHHNGYVGIFCIANVLVHPLDKHMGIVNNYAARVNIAIGDNFEQTCGGDLVQKGGYNKRYGGDFQRIKPERVNSPEFNRMINALKEKGITPRYFINEYTLEFL